MPRPPAYLSELDRDELLAHVAEGTVSTRVAVALLTMHGDTEQEAAREVFHALGGSDRTELDSAGCLRYVGSGKRVRDVELAIAGAAEAG